MIRVNDSLYLFSQKKYPARPKNNKEDMTADTINRSRNKIGANMVSFGPKILSPLFIMKDMHEIYIRRAVDCKNAKNGREGLSIFIRIVRIR